MALPPTIHKASINLADLDRQVYQQFSLTVARHPSETAERMVARLLAYALCFEDGLSFTKGICAGDEPDLWCKGADGRITLWIEVGLPDPERLLKASRHVERSVLLLVGSGRRRWEASHLARLSAVANLELLAVDQPFIDQLVARLERGIAWDITVTEGTIYLEVAGTTLEGQLTRFSA
jgi:uncharacterized protein YaeQ